jgi:hypothetical protein
VIFDEKNFNIIKSFSHFAGVFRAVNTFLFSFAIVEKKKYRERKFLVSWKSVQKKAQIGLLFTAAMAGFLDEWRKPSRLLQDVKTKSIERTLLPLIKQVRRNIFRRKKVNNFLSFMRRLESAEK